MERITPCLFCEIANQRVSATIVYETEHLLAFLDIFPIRKGHVQIIPRQHFGYFEELPINLASEIVAAGQLIARAQKRLYAVERTAFLFSGGDIPHVHAHVVPMHDKTDITSRRYIAEESLTFVPAPRATKAELTDVASELKSAMNQPL
ncbi:HIT family protein [Neorhizobium sp. T25_27]|uniref:HIT family protein n=1 Tax=Neorhizobium sp. T25_27 TaxID=2093831 RepID=UPI000CF91A14|nr:HIT family protein [Neorhizobium sp. T25_27]